MPFNEITIRRTLPIRNRMSMLREVENARDNYLSIKRTEPSKGNESYPFTDYAHTDELIERLCSANLALTTETK